jgi:hypothetical protein
VNFDDLCPLDMWSTEKQEDGDGKGALQNFQICGKDVPRGYWVDTQRLCFTLLNLLSFSLLHRQDLKRHSLT